MYVLGIDGGGTRTTGVIANAKGEVLSKVVVGSSNLNSAKKSVVIEELTKLIFDLKNKTQTEYIQVKHVFAGMSGVRDSETKTEMREIISNILKNDTPISVDTDAIIALYSGTLGRSGIVQIAGTGAMAYGENECGDRGRVGGWGHLFSDHGSGYSIGRDGLNAAFKAFDGINESTMLQPLFLEEFKATDLPDIIQKIYRNENPKRIIASLGKLVFKAATDGDQTAMNIINVNARHLGESIVTLAGRLFDHTYPEVIPVVLTGGVFNRFDLLKEPIAQVIPKELQVEFIIPNVGPVSGAVIAGFKEENIDVAENFTRNFYTTFKEKGN